MTCDAVNDAADEAHLAEWLRHDLRRGTICFGGAASGKTTGEFSAVSTLRAASSGARSTTSTHWRVNRNPLRLDGLCMTGRIVRRVASASCISSCTHCEASESGVRTSTTTSRACNSCCSVCTHAEPPERPCSSYQTSRLGSAVVSAATKGRHQSLSCELWLTKRRVAGMGMLLWVLESRGHQPSPAP